jgi:hypothetical protein
MSVNWGILAGEIFVGDNNKDRNTTMAMKGVKRGRLTRRGGPKNINFIKPSKQ